MVRDIAQNTEHNVKAGVACVLLATDHHFLQVLEVSY